jgi:hypothetical protein
MILARKTHFTFKIVDIHKKSLMNIKVVDEYKSR